MKIKLLSSILLLTLFTSNIVFAQFSDVTVTVRWGQNSYENKLEIYNTANDLLVSLCDDTQCYTATQQGVTDAYGGKYDLGCVADGNNYYIKMYDIANDGWQSAYVSVIVAGVEVINNDGSTANTSGQTIYFNVSGGGATCNSLLDTDNDGIADYLDYDDDADGITDAVENLGQDRFECTLPALEFENAAYDAAASTGSAGNVGAIYRYSNAIQGHDVLMEITEMTGATIANIDNDTIDNPTFLQTEITLIGTGTPGVTFKFTIVDAGTTTPSTTIFRINGITWDTDGSGGLKESVLYYNPAAYGTENPTSLEVTDLGSNNIQISASGLQEGPGFSTLKVLRAYYQFIGNSFTMRMQAIKTSTSTTTRQFGMSFTQCEFLDFNANSLIIITGEDFDNDGKYNHLDLDSDNDGIPDNVEGQTTLGYLAPSLTVDSQTGIDTVYGAGIDVVNTDNDKYPDILDLDTDGDGLLDIEENGMANAITIFSDADNDGLDALFEGANLVDPIDVNDDINTPSASILPDVDNDVFTNGDVDYRDLFDTNPPASALLDFDGVDDYLATDAILSGQDQVTLMAWINADVANIGTTTIVGEDRSCKLYLRNGNRPTFAITTDGNPLVFVSTNSIAKGEWHHIAGTFSSSTGILKLYVDGEFANSLDTGITGDLLETSTLTSEAFAIGKTSRNVANKEFFNGAIDEVRVFDTVLTDDQIQRSVYQEIQENAGNVNGSVINKDIIDIATDTKVLWNNLIAYYPMSDIVSSRTFDYSSNNNHLSLYNITSVQEQTAPMPYESKANSDWSLESTWLHGDVWDIEDATNNKDWSIVRINSNVTTSRSHTQLGMIIENNMSLSVNGDNEINNTWFLELDGTIDLANDSQLIQGENSDLVTSANGKILRRQNGASDVYWYTYMSSPVGALGVTTLTDNNASINNANNTAYSFDTLKEGNGNVVQFTTAYNEVGKLSTRWMYTFQNGLTYYDWVHFNSTTALNPGIGYIHKGMGNGGSDQEFIFEGKPNNGTIKIAADDVDGDSGNESQPDVTQTTTLIGNPYPSAIDAHKFIDDNAGIIDGTLYFWHQWAGNSHNLAEYEGGYALLNKMAKIRAYQFVGMSGANNGSQDGTLTPTQYIAVGQSFFTEVVADGEIEFNNGQRIFKREALGESQHFRTNETANQNDEDEENSIQIIKLEFVTSNNLFREIAIGFSDFTSSSEFDYGYDGKMFAAKQEDIYTNFGDQKMVTQAFDAITYNTEVPIGLNASGNQKYSIKATEFTNFDKETGIYLRDNLTNGYFDLTTGDEYGFESEPGQFDSRFTIVFKKYKSVTEEGQINNVDPVIYFKMNTNTLFVKGLETLSNNVTIVNSLGQSVVFFNNVSKQSLENGLQINNLSSGVYMVSLKTETNQILNKKIIID